MNNPTPDVKSVFGRAAEIPSPAGRAAYLDEACAGHPAVRSEIETLLKALGQAGSFMAAPAAPVGETASYADPVTEGEGTTIGPYTLREQIGEGGFGLVFVAEQQQPVRRKVALKVIKPGMDTRQVVARFEAERQALALMDHPNIAKVFDAGTTDAGRPYFVMELVKGVPITEYADANNLTPNDRLGLFVQVCQAVQHAHQKGVIHRDLKPSNVLVAPHDGVPVVKVIDFGVAKALGQSLTDKTIYTRFAQMIGTPLYMSPEQAEVNQLDVDTRSDVYSLGVLLYELLTGTTPFDQDRFRKAAFDEIRRIIKEEEPPRPSTRLTALGATLTAVSARRGTDPGRLAGLVRGELDWIVMRCLEKDRTRRYDGAANLAKDVQRYLSGDAVEACPPTFGYRLKKAYRRNRPVILAGGAFAAVLLGATGVSLAFGLQATRAGGEAEARRLESDDNARRAEENEDRAQREAAQVRAEQDRIRRLLYASEMASASTAFNEGRDDRVLQVLAETTPKPGEPDLRGWEWHYLNRLYDPPMRNVQFGSPPPADDKNQFVAVLVRTRSVVTRLDAAANKAWFEVYDTATGRREARIPKEGSIETRLPSDGGGIGVQLPRPVLDEGEQYLAARVFELDGKKNFRWRIRLWKLSTCEEVDGPPPTPASNGATARPTRATSSGMTLGPDAQWISWVMSRASDPNDPQKSERLLTVHRWDRADGKLRKREITAGPGIGITQLSSDGESAFLLPSFVPGADKLACWDVTADPPKPRYSMPVPRPQMGLPVLPLVTNGTRTAAALWDGKDLVVHSLADGKELWRHALENKPSLEAPNFGRTRGFNSLSDDGKRVVFRDQFKLTVVEHPDPSKPNPAREWVVRHRPLAIPNKTPGGRRLPPVGGGEILGAAVVTGTQGIGLSPDGRTMYTGLNTETMKLGMIDLSADPQWAGPESRPRRALKVEPGPGIGEVRRYLVQDEEGKTLFPFPQTSAFTPFVLGERWVLNNTSGSVLAKPGPSQDVQDDTKPRRGTWELYDVGGATAARLVASGEGESLMSPDNRWLFVANKLLNRITNPFGPGISYRAQSPWTTTTVYRVETGEKVSEVTAPPGQVFTRLMPETNGKRWAVICSPAPREGPVDPALPPIPSGILRESVPYSVRVYDTETGAVVLENSLGTSVTRENSVSFSDDGWRVFVGSLDKRELSRFHVVNMSDGSVENTFTISTDGAGVGLIRGLPDGKLVFRYPGGEIQVWDPATSKPIHRLTGQTDVTRIACSPDSRRLFVLEAGITSRVRVHVWDLVTGRELLVLPAPKYVTQFGDQRFEFANGKLRYSSTDGMRVLDGTPLAEPTK